MHETRHQAVRGDPLALALGSRLVMLLGPSQIRPRCVRAPRDQLIDRSIPASHITNRGFGRSRLCTDSTESASRLARLLVRSSSSATMHCQHAPPRCADKTDQSDQEAAPGFQGKRPLHRVVARRLWSDRQIARKKRIRRGSGACSAWKLACCPDHPHGLNRRGPSHCGRFRQVPTGAGY